MFHNAMVFLACILGGFALLSLGGVPLIASFIPFLKAVGAIAIIVFAFALFLLGLKLLFSRKWS
ncbi:hypothetical protein [Mesobacillus harenae]|uniref:hypothetical protein n=1 Tax=Mesobacillus harenae TaxID=2213203 RepID=UPI00157FDA5D|nr:hypothetical protein [Mesobacillus harenae]